MDKRLKELIKEAILEALVEFTNGGVAVAADNKPSVGGGNNSGNSGQGGASEDSSGGGTFGDGRPRPDAGVGAFSLR